MAAHPRTNSFQTQNDVSRATRDMTSTEFFPLWPMERGEFGIVPAFAIRKGLPDLASLGSTALSNIDAAPS